MLLDLQNEKNVNVPPPLCSVWGVVTGTDHVRSDHVGFRALLLFVFEFALPERDDIVRRLYNRRRRWFG